MWVFRRWLPLVVSCLLATGCSMATLGYEFFPSYALWQIDSYLGMDSEQRATAQRRLGELHRWHRQSQLPAYVDFIKSVRERPLTSSTSDEAYQVRQRAVAAWQPVAEQLAPGLAEMLLTVKPAQVDRLKERFAKENRKLREEYLPSARSGLFGRKDEETGSVGESAAADSPAGTRKNGQLLARQEARANRLKKRIEYFLGDLSPAQENLLLTLSSEQPGSEEVFLAEREARQQRFLALIGKIQGNSSSQAEAEALCKTFLAGLWISQDATRKQRLDDASRRNDQLTARMMTTATPDQQAHFVDRMKGWERNFAKMAGLD